MTTTEMREPTFLVLTALAGGDQHGYALMELTERLSEGRVRLKPGTLYAALDRLQGEGLVTTTREEVVDGRTRRYMGLTDLGAAQLAAAAERLEANARQARARLAGRARAGARASGPAVAS